MSANVELPLNPARNTDPPQGTEAIHAFRTPLHLSPGRTFGRKFHVEPGAKVSRFSAALAVVILVATLNGGVGVAATSTITDLGRPTSDVPSGYFPLGAFRQTRMNLREHGKPELLFIGTQIDANSAAGRWPIVKALEQFGNFKGLRATTSPLCSYSMTPSHGTPAHKFQCSASYRGDRFLPTFDWTGASYTSRVVAFVPRELIYRNLHYRRPLGGTELTLFNRYARVSLSSWRTNNWNITIAHMATFEEGGQRQLPLIGVGRYVETGANTASPGEMQTLTSGNALTFEQVRDSLRNAKAVAGAPPSLITDYNAEANVITALICHADGLKPTNVCGRSVIRRLLRHVK